VAHVVRRLPQRSQPARLVIDLDGVKKIRDREPLESRGDESFQPLASVSDLAQTLAEERVGRVLRARAFLDLVRLLILAVRTVGDEEGRLAGGVGALEHSTLTAHRSTSETVHRTRHEGKGLLNAREEPRRSHFRRLTRELQELLLCEETS
jgi:hypothetical protein